MTGTRHAVPRGKLYTRELANGTTLHAELSPCVFMYPGYPLQVQVTFLHEDGQSGGSAFVVDRQLNCDTANESDVVRLLACVSTMPCKRCSALAFDPGTAETNRDGLCEQCFLGDLQSRVDEAMEEERRLLADQDRRMKAKGMRFRVTAWIHGDEGDDFQVDWYFAGRPTKAAIRKLLSEQGSSILDDFQVITLAPARKRASTKSA